MTKKGDGVAAGDRLIAAYTLGGAQWHRTTIEFQDGPDGTFVYTGVRPQKVVIIPERELREGTDFKNVRRSVAQERTLVREDRWTDSYCYSVGFFDGCNPLSPFFGLPHFHSPFGLHRHLFDEATDIRRASMPADARDPFGVSGGFGSDTATEPTPPLNSDFIKAAEGFAVPEISGAPEKETEEKDGQDEERGGDKDPTPDQSGEERSSFDTREPDAYK